MYKKSLKILFVVINIIVVSTVFVCLIKQDNIKQTEREFDMTKEYTMIKFPQYTINTQDYIKELKAIEKTSKELNIPYVKRTYYFGSGIDYKNYNYSNNFRKVLFESNTLRKSGLSKKFGVNFKDNMIYSTEKNINAIKIKKYSDVDFTIKHISLVKKPISREGIFFIKTKDSFQINKFYKYLCLNYNNLFSTKYTLNSFKPKMIYPTSQDLMLDNGNMHSILIALIVFQVIVFLTYILVFSNDNIIYRLLGLSTSEIIQRIVIKQLIYSCFFAVFSWALYELITNRIQLIGKSLFIILILLMIETFISYVFFKFLNKIPLHLLVRSIRYSKYILGIVFSLKGILLGIVALGIFPIINAQYDFINSANSLTSQPYSKYATFYPYDQGYNEEINPTDSVKIASQKIYPKLNKNGAIYIDTSAINTENPKIMRNADINPNYLNFNPLYSLKNKRIVISDREHSKIILIPVKYKKYNNALKKYYRRFYKKNITLIFLKNNQPICNTNGKYIKNYTYIDVKTLGNKEDYNLFTGRINDTLKLPLERLTPSQLYKRYKGILSKYNFRDNLPQLVMANSERESAKAFLESSHKTIIPIIISIIVLIMISISMLYLYFVAYGHDYVIKRINGVFYFKQLGNYWVVWLIEVFLLAVYQNFCIEPLVKVSSLFLFSTIVIFDFLISIIGLKVFSSSALRRFLIE